VRARAAGEAAAAVLKNPRAARRASTKPVQQWVSRLLRTMFQWPTRLLSVNAGPETQAFSRSAVANI